MNDRPEPVDPLEAELQSLQPAALSEAWYARVKPDLPAEAGRRPARLTAACGFAAAAACVVVGVALWRVNPPRPIGVPVVATRPPVPVYDRPNDDRPALLVYRQALSQSPGVLDDLLDRHAARSLAGGTGARPGVRVTASSDLRLLP